MLNGWKYGGESGIRTHDTVSRIHAFQACAFSHSAISPATAGKREAPTCKPRQFILLPYCWLRQSAPPALLKIVPASDRQASSVRTASSHAAQPAISLLPSSSVASLSGLTDALVSAIVFSALMMSLFQNAGCAMTMTTMAMRITALL